MENDKHVVAVFRERGKAEAALEELLENGFRQDQISMLISQSGRGHHFEVSDSKTKTAEGVGYGAVIGGLIAGLTTLAVPGSIFVAGPIVNAFAVAATGAATGGLLGGLTGMGIAEDEARLVENEVGQGNIVLAVHSIDADSEQRAERMFKQAGAARVH